MVWSSRSSDKEPPGRAALPPSDGHASSTRQRLPTPACSHRCRRVRGRGNSRNVAAGRLHAFRWRERPVALRVSLARSTRLESARAVRQSPYLPAIFTAAVQSDSGMRAGAFRPLRQCPNRRCTLSKAAGRSCLSCHSLTVLHKKVNRHSTIPQASKRLTHACRKDTINPAKTA